MINDWANSVFCLELFIACDIADLWPWDSHVQFSTDGHTGDLLVMSTEDLHWPGRQTAGEAILKDKKNK